MSFPQPNVSPAGSSSAQPRRGSGNGAGITSLVFSLIAPASMIVTAPISLLTALFTRPAEGPGSLTWVAPLVLWSLPMIFGLLAVSLGVAAVRGSPPGSNSWTAAAASLWISGLQVAAAMALVLRNGDFMILF
ncbi:hypothetical protein [Arthrobacter sp. Y81]|uniref:hypothetical protein n=1 Tax=Arthrobacter sp. Y81 TaxID=2058897 RepID=UPI0011B0CA54|nr:hypothetical protein [Arthrobacter sp. Y81]